MSKELEQAAKEYALKLYPKSYLQKDNDYADKKTVEEMSKKYAKLITDQIQPELEQAAKIEAINYADAAIKKHKDYAISAKADWFNGCVEGFKAGAEWMKKQDELTWQDVKQIVNIADMLIVSNEPSKFPNGRRFYEEVAYEYNRLKRIENSVKEYEKRKKK